MEQEVHFIKKRFVDLSRRAADKDIVTFSNFLNLNELTIFHQTTKELYSSVQLFGGYSHAERQMAAFLPDALYYDWQYPIDAVRVTPSNSKFAEKLTHRDVLGALMNLGIKREMLGDILILDSEIIILCVNSVSSYLMEHCIKIRRTMVHSELIPMEDFNYEPALIEKAGIVSSLRLDNVIADICSLSKASAQKLIMEGNAFLNSQKIQRNDHNCQNGDILSVRHYGKYQLQTTDAVTKKGRIKYIYKIYS